MAAKFHQHGISAECLSGESNREHRLEVQGRLRRREINFLFVVDLYNEGIDIPEVDTVLFLRPTESLTVFLQQLGRGLRLIGDKECLTVLDFVGQAHRNFRFDLRYRALLTDPSVRVDEQVEHGFTSLPARPPPTSRFAPAPRAFLPAPRAGVAERSGPGFPPFPGGGTTLRGRWARQHARKNPRRALRQTKPPLFRNRGGGAAASGRR